MEPLETESGLVIPDRDVPPTYKNEVLALGPDVEAPVAEGDYVLTTPFVGDEVRYEQKVLFLVNEDDLLAVLPRK